MTDREKVIKGIGICLDRFRCGAGCPYYANDLKSGCMEQLRDDAITLLKKYEPQKPYRHYAAMEFWYSCGSCKAEILENDKYCHECGQAVKWE